MQLTEHFSLYEMLYSATADKRGINNIPPKGSQIYPNLTKLANALEEVRELFGKSVIVNSGYRCAELNKAVGGVRNSAHLTGFAADIVVKGISPKEVTKRITASNIQFDQCIDEGTWTHFSIDPRMRRESFKAA